VLFGPPAVGKLAVGRALERLTGLPLFHNHMTIDLVLPFFEFGSAPFSKLVRSFREQIFEEVAASQLPGLIFTYVWAFNDPGDEEFVRALAERFESRGGRVVFVELWADLSTRLERNRTELRLLEKPSKRDLEKSDARVRQAEEKVRMRSDGGFPFPPSQHLLIDNTHMDPDEVARRVAEHFRL
jgi:hypothetical protein